MKIKNKDKDILVSRDDRTHNLKKSILCFPPLKWQQMESINIHKDKNGKREGTRDKTHQQKILVGKAEIWIATALLKLRKQNIKHFQEKN